MKNFGILLGLIVLLTLISCGSDSGSDLNARLYETDSCEITDQGTYTEVVCSDGSKLQVPHGKDGQDGTNGSDGANGAPGALLSTVTVDDNQCKQILPNVWVENISGGTIFDVYYNATCADADGEYCDNVMAQYGSSGQLGSNKPGSGTHCWVDNYFISGVRLTGSQIKINIVTFQ